METLDPDLDCFGTGIQPKMLDPDPESNKSRSKTLPLMT
jgi:hypothetical protein